MKAACVAFHTLPALQIQECESGSLTPPPPPHTHNQVQTHTSFTMSTDILTDTTYCTCATHMAPTHLALVWGLVGGAGNSLVAGKRFWEPRLRSPWEAACASDKHMAPGRELFVVPVCEDVTWKTWRFQFANRIKGQREMPFILRLQVWKNQLLWLPNDILD